MLNCVPYDKRWRVRYQAMNSMGNVGPKFWVRNMNTGFSLWKFRILEQCRERIKAVEVFCLYNHFPLICRLSCIRMRKLTLAEGYRWRDATGCIVRKRKYMQAWVCCEVTEYQSDFVFNNNRGSLKRYGSLKPYIDCVRLPREAMFVALPRKVDTMLPKVAARTWVERGSNPGCRGGKSATNSLSYGTAPSECKWWDGMGVCSARLQLTVHTANNLLTVLRDIFRGRIGRSS
jgi:hypothetical protein